jgi:predicted dehydrogenase
LPTYDHTKKIFPAKNDPANSQVIHHLAIPKRRYSKIMTPQTKIGVIGCGRISGVYLWMARSFPQVKITACADMNLDLAKAKAAEYEIPKGCSVQELLHDPEIELVLNLTTPQAHFDISMQTLQAGKHSYSEKPLGISRQQGITLLQEAHKKNLLVGCAPDTFMGSGIQTVRRLIDDGAIGRPLAFTAFMMCRGHESWHPNPEFYYQIGGGPMFDMGPYYLTALLNFFGPVKRISGMASISLPERTITSEFLRGQKFKVHTPDHVVGTMEFQNGCIGSIITTFATMHPNYDGNQPITIYGESGSLRVPDPNLFDGKIHLRTELDSEWKEIEPMFPTGYGRAVGAADMALSIHSKKPFRANGQQAMAVLDLMSGFLDSSDSGGAFSPSVAYTRPEPMPIGQTFGKLQ